MNLKLLRFDRVMQVDKNFVTTLQVEERTLFARLAQSFVSEKGVEALEPYELILENGKAANSKNSFVVLSQLPIVPLDDKGMLGKLYEKTAVVLSDFGKDAAVAELAGRIFEESGQVEESLWGSYDFAVDWDVITFLKAFKLRPVEIDGATLLEKFIGYFRLCVDIGMERPILLVNAKSFFDEKDLNILFEQAVFHEISLVLLESWHDDIKYPLERKYIIDQDLLEY